MYVCIYVCTCMYVCMYVRTYLCIVPHTYVIDICMCMYVHWLQDEDGNGLTDLEIREQVDTFMFEGHDTTANSLCWILYLLAKHPEHQDKCREEIDAIFKEKDEIEWLGF